MNLFTRITATLGASADNAVSRFENHDAIAESALVQARQALTKARVRHNRLLKTGDELRKQLADRQAEADQWTQRARTFAQSDETRALECLALRKRCVEQVEQLQQSLEKHHALEDQMTTRLKDMQHRLDAMSNQRNEMRSRESLARAVQVMDRIDTSGSDSVDAVFERWEMSIGDTEIRHEVYQDQHDPKPALQRELEAMEQQESLKDELAELMSADEDKANG